MSTEPGKMPGLGNSVFLLIWHSIGEHDDQLPAYSSPVPDRHRPFLADFKGRQIQRLQQGLRTRENASLTVQTTIGWIQWLYGIRRVESRSDILWELEDRRYGIPVIVPPVHGMRIMLRPFFRNSFQSWKCILFISSFLDIKSLLWLILS